MTDIVELADSENHAIEPKITTLSYRQPMLWQFKHLQQSLTGTIKLADLDNPLAGASICSVSPAQAELYPILC